MYTQNYYNYFFIYSFCFYFIFLVDNLLTYLLGNKTRWFQLHFFINMVIVYLSYRQTYNILLNPIKSYENNDDITCFSFAGLLHIYHSVFFKLKTIDYYHHISSVFIPGLIINNVNRKITYLYYFFGTGLPGGLEYLSLVLNKQKYITKIQQKYISSILNSYIRIPGAVISSYLSFNIANNVSDNVMEQISLYILTIIIFLNGIIFGKMSIENYVEYKL